MLQPRTWHLKGMYRLNCANRHACLDHILSSNSHNGIEITHTPAWWGRRWRCRRRSHPRRSLSRAQSPAKPTRRIRTETSRTVSLATASRIDRSGAVSNRTHAPGSRWGSRRGGRRCGGRRSQWNLHNRSRKHVGKRRVGEKLGIIGSKQHGTGLFGVTHRRRRGGRHGWGPWRPAPSPLLHDAGETLAWEGVRKAAKLGSGAGSLGERDELPNDSVRLYRARRGMIYSGGATGPLYLARARGSGRSLVSCVINSKRALIRCRVSRKLVLRLDGMKNIVAQL